MQKHPDSNMFGTGDEVHFASMHQGESLWLCVHYFQWPIELQTRASNTKNVLDCLSWSRSAEQRNSKIIYRFFFRLDLEEWISLFTPYRLVYSPHIFPGDTLNSSIRGQQIYSRGILKARSVTAVFRVPNTDCYTVLCTCNPRSPLQVCYKQLC